MILEALKKILETGQKTRIGNGYTIDCGDVEKDIWMFSSKMWGEDYYVYINNEPMYKNIDGEVTMCKDGDWQRKVLKEAEKKKRV